MLKAVEIVMAGIVFIDEILAPLFTRQHMELLSNKITHQLRRNKGRKHPDKVKTKLRELRKLAERMKGRAEPGV